MHPRLHTHSDTSVRVHTLHHKWVHMHAPIIIIIIIIPYHNYITHPPSPPHTPSPPPPSPSHTQHWMLIVYSACTSIWWPKLWRMTSRSTYNPPLLHDQISRTHSAIKNHFVTIIKTCLFCSYVCYTYNSVIYLITIPNISFFCIIIHVITDVVWTNMIITGVKHSFWSIIYVKGCLTCIIMAGSCKHLSLK